MLSVRRWPNVLFVSFFALCLLSAHAPLKAQLEHQQEAYVPQARHWVFFARTGENGKQTPVRAEQTALRHRALQRRSRLGIPLDRADVPLDAKLMERLEAVEGVTVHRSSRWLHAVSVATDDPELLATLSTWPEVVRIEPVRRYRVARAEQEAQALLEPLQPSFRQDEQIGCCAGQPAYGAASNQVQMLGADVLHNAGFQGQDILVGVFDGGFRGVDQLSAFQGLWDDNRVVDYWNFHLNNDSVFDYSGHGTAVLSCIAVNSCQDCYAGTAPRASVALYLTEVVGFERIIEEDNWVAAAERADAIGVDIINTSLGYTTFDSVDQAFNHTYADMDGNTTIISRAADWAASRGMLVVVSAGNQGGNSWRYISAPADGDSVLAVGAVFQDGRYAFFSGYGPSSDGDVKPNLAAVGALTWVVNSGGVVSQSNGTSFAAPLVAGAAASLWSAVPQAGNMDLFDALQRSGHLAHNPNDSLGYGIPYLPTAWQVLQDRQSAFAEGEPLAAWPSPVRGNTVWIWQGEGWDVQQPWRVRAIDRHGRVVLEQEKPLFGAAGHAIPVQGWAGLPPGTYVLQAAQGTREQSVKISVSP